MWRCWALRRFVVSRRAAGAQAAGGCSVGCVQYLGSLKMSVQEQKIRLAVLEVSVLQYRVIKRCGIGYVTHISSALVTYFTGNFFCMNVSSYTI